MKTDSRLRVADLTIERGGRRILDSVGVQFASGTVTAVLGPNGAGKSTLLKIIARVYAPNAGEVSFEQKPLPQWPAKAYG